MKTTKDLVLNLEEWQTILNCLQHESDILLKNIQELQQECQKDNQIIIDTLNDSVEYIDKLIVKISDFKKI